MDREYDSDLDRYNDNAESDEEFEERPVGKLQPNKVENICEYCEESDQRFLVKCNVDKCGKWFCNSTIEENSTSHIVFHMIKAKHKEILLSEHSPIGELVPECYNCSTKNMFLLGFLESIKKDSGFIICREPCLNSGQVDKNDFDKTTWRPLITKKALIEILVEPIEKLNRYAASLSVKDILMVEDRLADLNQEKQPNERRFRPNLEPAKLIYKNGNEYLKIQHALVTAEMLHDKKMKSSQGPKHLEVKFVKSMADIYAIFYYPRDDIEIKLALGDEMHLSGLGSKKLKGNITRIEMDDEIQVTLKDNTKKPDNGLYNVELNWLGTAFKRMLQGLNIFVKDQKSVSNYIYNCILGNEEETKKTNYNYRPSKYSVEGLPELNYYQEQGIIAAIENPLILIQGPPGTGKTVTSAALVYHLVKLNVGKVFVSTPSNIASDQLAEKIDKTGVKVVRMCAKSRETISTRADYLSLHNLIKDLDGKKYAYLLELEEKMSNHETLSKKELASYKKLKERAERDIMRDAEVIVTTCASSFDKRLESFNFPIVLIDEATQACEPELLLPMLSGAKHVILVGDHCQLGPVIVNKEAAKSGLSLSLFERLVKLKVKPHMLQVQYRMHPALSEFPSNTFYSGNLQNGISARERVHHNSKFTWPNEDKPYFFFHTNGTEEFSPTGLSYLNRNEAEFIEKIISQFLKSCYFINSHLAEPNRRHYALRRSTIVLSKVHAEERIDEC